MKKHSSNIILLVFLITTFASLIFFQPTMSFADVGHGVAYEDDSGGDGGIWFIIYLFIRHPYLMLILVVIYFVLKKTTGIDLIQVIRKTVRGDKSPSSSRKQVQRDKGSIIKLQEKDSNFSDAAFISKVNNMFMQLQDSWMRKEWSSIRPFETDALFSMHERQLQRFIDNNQTNVIKNIGILNSEIVRYESDAINDKLYVKIEARFNDYIIDDYSQKVLQGDPKKDIYMTYVWTLIRKSGVLTDSSKEGLQASQCPNCGANVSISQSGQCEYCDSVISSGEYDWILSEIQVVNQR